ncbi:hypothetical protein HDU85_004850 [Gaertneriomyces sp. JEL0708]|nr:hypothetical protein HDU85_004850 [Gaertneriomyces sp. JEL0708]
MQFKSSTLCAAVALLAHTAAAQCVDKPVVGNAAFIAEGFEGVKAEVVNNAYEWNIIPSADGKGWISVHYEEDKCTDLSQYKGVEFDMTVPAGGEFAVTWNIRNPDCLTKSAVEQQYQDGKTFLKGGKLSVPFAAFGDSVNAKYVEDMTLINFKGPAQGWKMANVVLKCDFATPSGSSPTPTGSSGTKPTASTKPDENAAAGPAYANLGAVAAIGAAAAALAL